jgi:hypothetical protein
MTGDRGREREQACWGLNERGRASHSSDTTASHSPA